MLDQQWQMDSHKHYGCTPKVTLALPPAVRTGQRGTCDPGRTPVPSAGAEPLRRVSKTQCNSLYSRLFGLRQNQPRYKDGCHLSCQVPLELLDFFLLREGKINLKNASQPGLQTHIDKKRRLSMNLADFPSPTQSLSNFRNSFQGVLRVCIPTPLKDPI